MSHHSAGQPAMTIDHPEQLTDLVRKCSHAKDQPIVDYGIAHAGLGHPPPRHHVRLVQRGSLIDLYDGDLTVRAGAGVTVGHLQATLRNANQFLPIDADEDLTLGEVIVHNVYGPLRVGYGSVRDLLLGLRYVDAVGRDIHVGGRTVKNVAGYDVSRFMIGSLGELGCVYEATLRTSAIPDAVWTTQISASSPTWLDQAMTDLLTCDAAPVHASLQTGQGRHTVHLGYFGHSDGCQAQLRALESFINQVGGASIDQTQAYTLDQDTQQRSKRQQWRRQASALVKLIVPPAQTGASCQMLEQSTTTDLPPTIDALPVHGCLFIGGDLDGPECHKLDQQIQRIIDTVGGVRVWYTRPNGAESIPPFAPHQPDWTLLARLKQTMDPQNLFNPGRFLTGGPLEWERQRR